MVPDAFGEWLVQAPLWSIGVALFVGMCGAALAGVMFRRRLGRSADVDAPADKDSDSQEGYFVSAVFGLLALLTGFTFAMAIDRYDTRRERVLVEANAIGTTYLRAQLLDEPHRSRISLLLLDYTDNRIELAQAPPGQTEPLLERNDQLVTDLWTATVAAFPSMRPYDFSSSFLESMNEVIDLDAARKVARKSHVPPAVFFILFAYQLIGAGVIGYVLVGRKGRLSAIVLFVLFGVSLVLILDIDRPTTGSVRESQEAMLQLQSALHSQPPETFDRFIAPALP